MNESLWRVAVDAPVLEPLTYSGGAQSEISRGQSVRVPLGRRQAQGVVLGPGRPSNDYTLKEIGELIATRPAIPEPYLRWLEWLADYYVYPVGQVMALAFPPLESERRKRKSHKSAVVKPVLADQPPSLTAEQTRVVADIQGQPGFATHLLHGVTGAGKTEVYLRLLANVIERGQQGLVLVPEISLTPQLVARFVARFGDKVAVLHSHLTDREKTEQWWSAVRGDKPILVGARSALFCPLPRLALIVVDEEHEPSFKQDEKLKYHARDAAVMLAKLANCPIVLGSATPSLESWHHARSGKYRLHSMTARVAERQMPTVSVVDLREDRRGRRNELDAGKETRPFWLTTELQAAMNATLAAGEQVALFLNRRGMAQAAICGACGWYFECPNCAISLTVHGQGHLVCHYCDYTDRLKESCPQCSSTEVKPLGLGTELVEQDLARLFPGKQIARADRDEIQSREALEELIERMEARAIDILIGTQMIAKGLDFPGLTLVGLLLADVGFSLPDFRASERSFQLLTQMSGRSGRHSDQPGRVIIQTYNPGHPAVVFAQHHDFVGFANHELTTRQELHYPPYSRLAMIRLSASTLGKAEEAAEMLKRRAELLRGTRAEYQSVRLLGPAPAPLTKLRGRFRFQALIKAEPAPLLRAFCRQLLADGDWLPTGTKASVDIDPINML